MSAMVTTVPCANKVVMQRGRGLDDTVVESVDEMRRLMLQDAGTMLQGAKTKGEVQGTYL